MQDYHICVNQQLMPQFLHVLAALLNAWAHFINYILLLNHPPLQAAYTQPHFFHASNATLPTTAIPLGVVVESKMEVDDQPLP